LERVLVCHDRYPGGYASEIDTTLFNEHAHPGRLPRRTAATLTDRPLRSERVSKVKIVSSMMTGKQPFQLRFNP